MKNNAMKTKVLLCSAFLVLFGGCKNEDSLNNSTTSLESSFVGTLIPLYSYPTDGMWDKLIETNTTLQTIAIINPNNGPVECNTSMAFDYAVGIAKLKAHSIKTIGYVYTGYANRSIDAVKGDINRYRECFSNLDGIFLDETNSSALSAPYYETLKSYIKETNATQLSVLNPGVYPEEAIVNASDIIVIYEEEGDGYDVIDPPVYVSNFSVSRFALLGYGVSSEALSETKLAKLKTAKVGYLYLTNDSGENPWDTLASYYNTLMGMLK